MKNKTNIINSFQMLKGNTRISVLFEPMWGIPFILYSLYLSLYMKSQGVTDQQLGWLIAIGCFSAVVFSLFSGTITDFLGRKRTTFIFDFLAWPLSLLIYLLGNNFWWFALATLCNGAAKVTAVSWNLILIEDAAPQEQIAAFNLVNTINISFGLLTPVSGLIVNYLGIVKAEKILLGIAVVSMSLMTLIRNLYYQESKVGQEIMAERRTRSGKVYFQIPDYQVLWNTLKIKPKLMLCLIVVVIFNIYLPIGTYNSLYYAPYLTEVLQLEKSSIAIFGWINALIMFLVFVVLIPRLMKQRANQSILVGLSLQALAMLGFMLIPAGRFWLTIFLVAVFAFGFGISKSFIDNFIVMTTTDKERSGIFALNSTIIAIISVPLGLASGYLYQLQPSLIYLISLIMVLCSLVAMYFYLKIERKVDEEVAVNI